MNSCPMAHGTAELAPGTTAVMGAACRAQRLLELYFYVVRDSLMQSFLGSKRREKVKNKFNTTQSARKRYKTLPKRYKRVKTI